MNISDIKLDLYVVVNQDGQFLRSIGYGGSGKSWVETIDKAKIYGKLGQARSRVTWWHNNYPDYGVPKIVKLTVSGTEIIDEIDRVNKAKEKKLLERANYQKRAAQLQLELAEKRLKEAQKEIAQLKNN